MPQVLALSIILLTFSSFWKKVGGLEHKFEYVGSKLLLLFTSSYGHLPSSVAVSPITSVKQDISRS